MQLTSLTSTRSRMAVCLAAGASALAVTVAGALPASADPANPAAVTIAGVGSDTTQGVVNALATAYNATSNPGTVGSWDAVNPTTHLPGDTINVKPSVAGCSIVRPNGSSAGIAALQADTKGCIDFARSSRVKKTDGTENGLAFFALARDAVTWATFPSTPTATPSTLTSTQLQAIYKCTTTNWNQISASLPSNPIHAYLPQVGSGTRNFFLSAIGLSDATVGTCVVSSIGGRPIEENDGTQFAKDKLAVVPYSIAKWIAQSRKAETDLRGGIKLKKISGIAPTVGSGTTLKINASFPSTFQRIVFNVVKKSGATVDPKYVALFGTTAQGGYFCTQTATISKFGFLPIGNCGQQF